MTALSLFARAAQRYATAEDVHAAKAAEERPQSWLARYFPTFVKHPFAAHHQQFWQWVWAVKPGVSPDPFVGIWARGGAKSTSAELAVAALGARGARRYVLYVSGTQEQANKHLRTIQKMLESGSIGRDYPRLGGRSLTKYGHSKGWTSTRLMTAAGFTVEAIGLDTAARGFKVEDQRPDLIVLDDIDEENDSSATTQKKIRTLTRALMPTGSTDVALLAIQNLVHPDSIFAQLADGRADYLANRIMSGPIPAVRDLTYEHTESGYRITGGTAVWAGQSLSDCQKQISDWGLTAFLAEAQHEVEAPAGGMFDHLDFQRMAWGTQPEFMRTVVWVDPAVTNTDQSDCMGIQVDALGVDDRIYRLFSWEARTSPKDALVRAIMKAYELQAEHVGVETDQGGDTWQSVYREALTYVLADHPELAWRPIPQFTSAKASQGQGPKTHRASRMLVDYEHGRIVHMLGTHDVLERALRRFPVSRPYDLVDAAFWSWWDLAERGQDVVFEWGEEVSAGPNI